MFNPGDKVRRIKRPYKNCKVGEIYTVLRLSPLKPTLDIELVELPNYTYDIGCFELVRSTTDINAAVFGFIPAYDPPKTLMPRSGISILNSDNLPISNIGPVHAPHLEPKLIIPDWNTGPKCECGSHSVGVDKHSTWCPRSN